VCPQAVRPMASTASKPARSKNVRVSSKLVSGAGTPVVDPAAIASTLPERYGRLLPPQRLFDITVPRATRSATTVLSLTLSFSHSSSQLELTTDSVIDKWSPERKTIIERTSRIFFAICFESNTCVHPTSPCRDVCCDEVVE
jgi:hypothetical protein